MHRVFRFPLFACLASALLALGSAAHAQWQTAPGYSPSAPILPGASTLETPQGTPYLDVDRYLEQGAGQADPSVWDWQVLPEGLIFRPYLAGPKEPRFSAHIFHRRHDGWLMDASLGSQVGLLRWGTSDPVRPLGFQIDAEGAALLRLDIPEEVDIRSGDFRAGVPVSIGMGRHRTKFAYYHLSSHVGDEFLLKNPGFTRLNYSRDALVLAHAIYLTDKLRVYGEAGWAFYSDVSQPWEFQFGLDYAPSQGTGMWGAPFFALNAQMRQEVDFGGGVTLQAGWAWHGDYNSRMLRAGLHYYNGESPQFSFFDDHEQQIGFGVWYDL